jgi:hypothetical protein
MKPIHTEKAERCGETYRIRIYPDPDAPNPLEAWAEMGVILSLNPRHVHFDRAGVSAAIDGNPDAVPLAYFEHGMCRWSVAGELPAACRCSWDSVPFAGIWLPDAATLTSAARYGGRTRQLFMRRRARQACDVYTDWCNGEAYGYEVAKVGACPCCGNEKAEPVDACWGYFGLDECLNQARAMLPPAQSAA